MRVGQKNKLTYRWARKGSRPRAVHDQRTQSTYLFGAVCPELGTGAALVLPACNSEAMQLHLDEIAIKVSPGAHAILLLDQAGWHGAKILKVPSNITLMPLPPRAPELNGQENIWQFMRQNWLSNRIFKSFDDIVDHCCYAWNTLIDQPWKIMSIARRDWATMGYAVLRATWEEFDLDNGGGLERAADEAETGATVGFVFFYLFCLVRCQSQPDLRHGSALP